MLEKNDRIDILLEKYFNAETSVSEENELRKYFIGNNVHSEHLKYVPLFLLFKEEEIAVPPKKGKNIYKILAACSVAAVIIGIALTIGVFFSSEISNDFDFKVNGKRVENKELALMVASDKIAEINKLMENVSGSTIEKLSSINEPFACASHLIIDLK